MAHKIITLDHINTGGGTQFRALVKKEVEQQYAELMLDGVKFPAVSLMYDGLDHWVVDGHQRIAAARLAGFKDISADVSNGSLSLAQFRAMAVNSAHGLPRDTATKKNQVEATLSHEMGKEMSDNEVAKHCGVSGSFVASVRNPEAKIRQAENKKNSSKSLYEKDAKNNDVTNGYFSPTEANGGHADDKELRAAEMAHEADVMTMQRLVDADIPLGEAYEEIKKLNFLNAQLQVRIDGLMNEKNEAVKMVKTLQSQIKKSIKK